MTTGAARDTGSTQRRLIDVASQGVCWTTGPATTGAEFGAGHTHCLIRDRATKLMVRARAMAALLSLNQTDITNASPINRASPQWMLNAAPSLATGANLRARLADKMGAMFAVAKLCHCAATGATDRSMHKATYLVNVKRYGQRLCRSRSRPVHPHLEGITMQRTKDCNGVE